MHALELGNGLYPCRLKELHVPEDSILWERWCPGQHGNQALLFVVVQDTSSFVAGGNPFCLFNAQKVIFASS